ncbi:MAG: peptidylprolyl isomerase [Lentisphaerae bacterium]|nr:peptidylprolyl isomerase [Lentisphaerota bacterium]
MEQVLARSHGGEPKVREELRVKLRIDQVLVARIGDLEVSDEEIAAFIEENKEKLTVDENVRARHILLTVAKEDDDTAKAEKKAKAEDLRKQLVEGAKFEDLAKEHSDCPSARMGGDLGRFRRGQMVKPFEEVAFTLEPGKISEVVETDFGYHIIEVLERNDEGTLPKEKVAEMLRNQHRETALKALVEELRQKASIKFASAPPQATVPPAPPVMPTP